MIRVARIAMLGLAILGFVWAAWLIFGGSADFTLFGIRLRSHEPLRPFTIGCIALAAFVLLERTGRKTTSLALPPTAFFRPVVQAGALSVAVTAFGIAYATTAASGSDPYGYVSQADLWLARDLHVEQPWVAEAPWPSKFRSFSPLGYRPPNDDGAVDGAIVPTYPSGLALVMAAAKVIGGQEAMFWIVPVAGGLLVLATYGIGQRMASPGVAIIAAWLMASCPVMLYMLVQPMSDVPVAAAWLTACYLLLQRGVFPGAVAGLAAAAAILIRPNLAFLAVVLAAWPVWQGKGRLQAAAFLTCASTGLIAVALINQHLYGSPAEMGHGDPGALFGWSHFFPNLLRYLTWLVESQTIVAVAGLAAILVPWRRIWPETDQRRLLLMPAAVVASVWLFYCFYLVFDEWAYLRFMLPALPFIAIGTGAVAVAIRRTGAKASALVAIALVLVVFAQYRFAVRRGAIDFWSGERRYVGVARLVAAETDRHSVIFSLQHSGSMRYYGGRTTLRFDNLDHESLDQAVQWLSSRGVRSYLLAEEWEVPMFEERFGGQATLAWLETPLSIYIGERYPAFLYDLTQSPVGAPQKIANPVEGLRSVSPAPYAGLELR